MFYALRRIFDTGSNGQEDTGVLGLLKDGTFMLWAAIWMAVLSLVLLIWLASGGAADVALLWLARNGVEDAFSGNFLRVLTFYRELKPVILLVIVVAGIVASVRYWAIGWSQRKPNPVLVVTSPQSSLGTAAMDEVDYDLEIPKAEEQIQLEG